MPKLRAHNLSISIDGYVAGPDQSSENPLGEEQGGGASTVQQCLRAGLVDDLDGGAAGYECVEMVGAGPVTHLRLEKTS